MTVDADPITEALASLYRLTDDLPVNVQAEGRRHVGHVQAELSRLREQRDAAQQDRNEYIDIAEREGARCARLQQGIRDRIAEMSEGWEGNIDPYVARDIEALRALLAGPDTPADSQPRPCPECKSPLACTFRGEVEPGYCLIAKQADSQPEEPT